MAGDCGLGGNELKFSSIIFVLDRRMVAFKDKKRKPDVISLDKLPKVPTIPSYHFLEESSDAAEDIREDMRPYVKGYFRKQSVFLCMPDDAPVFVDQKYMRDLFIKRGAGTNTTVHTLESLCLVKGREYVAISRSERMMTLTYRRGSNEPKRAFLPLALANPTAVKLAISGLSPEVDYNEPPVYILDPDEKLRDFYGLGKPLFLEDLYGMAKELSEKNWL